MTKDTKYLLLGLGAGVAVILTAAFLLQRMKRVKCSNSFLFIGDSNTAGSSSYADKFMSYCKNPKNKKIAKSGAKTSWMLPQLSSELKKNKYDVVTILAGSNDIFAKLSISEAKANMDKMLKLAKSTGAKVVVVTPPYKGHFSKTTKKHWDLIKEWNSYLKNHKTPIKFIDFSKIVQDKSLFSSDNQHVNSKGHQVLADAYLKKLNIA
jgi:lysophospholipase L1-like esterase